MMTKLEQLQQLETAIKSCRKCELCKTAKNAVVGEGNIDTDIVFIGEAPGATEDETGRPFVGRAGKLLEALLKKIDLERKDVWIGNIIKHRPPENRDPMPEEIAACEPYLTEQLKIINPKLIVTLGRFSMYYFYPDGKISRDRGNPIILDNYIVYPVYHPAAALRNPVMAKGLLEDFLKIPHIVSEVKAGRLSKKVTASKVTASAVSDGQIGLDL